VAVIVEVTVLVAVAGVVVPIHQEVRAEVHIPVVVQAVVVDVLEVVDHLPLVAGNF
jgi:hypothetical protein